MKTLPIRLIALLAVATLATACNGNKREASATAKSFLQAYYRDLDFEKALRLSSPASHNAISNQAEMSALNPYAQEEVPDIAFVGLEIEKNNPDRATCTYTCNRVEKTLPLHKINGKWMIHLNGGTVEAQGVSQDFRELSSVNQGGFAAATSGEIKYKKRRQGNN